MKKKCEICQCYFETGSRPDTDEFARRKTCSRSCMAKSATSSLISKKRGRLTVVDEYQVKKNKMIICECECGTLKEFVSTTVFRNRKNFTKSCGCLSRERFLPKAHPKFWGSWNGMKARALYSEHFGKSYLGKGIQKEWLDPKVFFSEMYESFKQHVAKYGDDVSIDRIDNKKGYFRGNCRWATREQQGRNKTNTHIVSSEEFGEITAVEYQEKTGKKILNRIYRGLSLPDGVRYVGRLGG